MQIDDILSIRSQQIAEIAAKFPNCKAVIFAGGPSCQGAPGLNASRRGAVEDPRSSLHIVFDEIKFLIQKTFTWCPSFFLMESVCSMGEEDRKVCTQSAEVFP